MENGEVMNERLKFRAWNIQLKDWEPFLMTSSDADIYYQFLDKECGSGSFYNFEGLNCLIFQQCTGLKDKKNGKLIYEGDIVKFEDDGGYFHTVPVFWNQERCAWGCKISDNITCGMEATNNYEILGNIFENRELLKTEKSSSRDVEKEG